MISLAREIRVVLVIAVLLHVTQVGLLSVESGEASIRKRDTRSKTLKVPLNSFTKYQTMDLKTISTSFPINFPIPDRWTVKDLRLILRYTNSITLIHKRSQITVTVNSRPVGQALLNPLEPNGVMDLRIPSAYLVSGYNALNFNVAQHYQDTCEQWDSPNLWTTLDFRNSFLEITYVENPVPLKLSEATAFMFDEKAFPFGEFNIVADLESPDSLITTGIVASGVAKRYEYKKVFFNASDKIKPGYDTILIGDKSYVEPILARRGVKLNVTGPLMKIIHLPISKNESDPPLYDKMHGLLVITGESAEEVRRTGAVLASMTIPFPGSSEAIINEFTLPDVAAYTGNIVIQGGREYPLTALNFRTHTFRKVNPLAIEIEFRIPNDYKIEPNKYMTLKLNYVYGPGLKEASSMTVSVNEKVARTIQLNRVSGDFIQGYNVDLPTYLFKPGRNTVTFTSYLTPIGENCEWMMPDSYFITLYDNSTLKFPKMSHFVEMPEIGYFMDDGFPFTRWSDGRECEIYITSPDYNLLSAALNIIGFITQRCEYPLFGSRLAVGVPQKPEPPAQSAREVIVVGSFDNLPPSILDQAPFRLGEETVAPYPVHQSRGQKTAFALSRQISGVDQNSGMLMEFESPFVNGRTALLFAAASPARVLKMSRLLLSPDVSSRMRGTLVFVDLEDGPETKIISIDTGKDFWTGKFGKLSALTYFLHAYPYTNYVIAIFLILLFSLVIYFLLARIRKRRLAVAMGRNRAD